jgi:hypothetical protein
MDDARTAVIEAYGARLAVSAPDDTVLDSIVASLPRGWSRSDASDRGDGIEWRFGVRREGDGYLVRDGDGLERQCAELDLAIVMLRTQMRRFVGYHAKDLVFVHAGVVAQDGAAMVLPGRSFAGKSTLVEALVHAGAVFYSDEYAMLDSQGRVAHYREPLILRGTGGQEEINLGPVEAQDPIPVGLVVLTTYKPGATWAPRQLTAAEGIVALMEHAVPARDRPAETLVTLRRTLADAQILSGDRGEARETASRLLETLRARGS